MSWKQKLDTMQQSSCGISGEAYFDKLIMHISE